MRSRYVSLAGAAVMALALSQPNGVGATTEIIYATSTSYLKDATIFANGTSNSNGAGPGMFVGSNGGTSPRRGLIRFDVVNVNSGILVGKTIDAVRLKLTVGMKAGSGGGDGTGGGSCGGGDPTSRIIDIYRVTDVSGTSTGDWGEGTTNSGATSIGGTGQGTLAGSTSGDATWSSRQYSSLAWAAGTGGGDYNSTASDSQSVSNVCPYVVTFSGTNMVSDVTGWLNSSFNNRGWILISQAEGSPTSFRAFWTKEGEALGFSIGSGPPYHYGPILEIDYH